MNFSTKILDFVFWRYAPAGETWGVGIADIDGDGYLDIYANHHGSSYREVIYGAGTAAPRNVELYIDADLHSATFFDVDQDGDLDLLQAGGGALGTVDDPDDPTFWNRVNLNDGGVLSTDNAARDLGLDYGPGRGRMLVPINLDGQIAIYAGVRNDRDDGSYPGALFVRGADGVYSPTDVLGPRLGGEFAKGLHFGTDRFVDVINVDAQARTLRVYENIGDGFAAALTLIRNRIIFDVETGDFNGDLQNDILVSQWETSSDPKAVIGSERIYYRDGPGDWRSNPTIATPRDTRTISLTAGDFDNDGDLDYAALQQIRGVELLIYLNRGDGTFTLGERVKDLSSAGRASYVVSGDFDRDGTLDFVVTNSDRDRVDTGVYTMISGAPNGNNWLSLTLKGVVSETGGLGSRVTVTTPDGARQMREQDSGARFEAQDATDLHFGLGSASRANVEIAWPDGYRQIFVNVAANQRLTLTEQRIDGYDRVYDGSAGADTMNGTAWNDFMMGRKGKDTLGGGGGDDALNGHFGDNSLFGGAGDDLLVGGEGTDRMSGDAGADVFRFLLVSDSRPGALRDVIRDFQPGTDVIDLAAIDADTRAAGDQAFVFIADAAFSGVAGQLRYAGQLLEADVNGDGVADFQVQLSGVAAVTNGDFLL